MIHSFDIFSTSLWIPSALYFLSLRSSLNLQKPATRVFNLLTARRFNARCWTFVIFRAWIEYWMSKVVVVGFWFYIIISCVEESRERITRDCGLVIRSRCRWGKCGWFAKCSSPPISFFSSAFSILFWSFFFCKSVFIS